MNALRGCWKLMRVLVHGLHGLAWVLLRFPSASKDRRQQLIRWWSAGMLRCLGVSLQVEGMPRRGATLLVANHVSWLDIMAVHSVCPHARFVSKAEVRHWPLIGSLVDAAGTLYLEREKRRDALRVVHRIAESLQQGDTVAVFPEGTTGPGQALLPFHANLLQAAIASGTPVQAVALRYADRQLAVSPAAAFVGETTLFGSLWMLACARDLSCHLHLLPALASRHADRRSLAGTLAADIGAALQAIDARHRASTGQAPSN
jgi:1-acyl-sn-glycerol-3-phosphate acyltransferase